MCGIFGVTFSKPGEKDKQVLPKILRDLFILSESRGKEASGIAATSNHELLICKDAVPAKRFVKKLEYKNIVDKLKTAEHEGLTAIGHTRLVTNGLQGNINNNQPVVKHDMVCVHNGIIVNYQELIKEHELSVSTALDTEVIPELINKFLKQYGDLKMALEKSFELIKGTVNCAIIFVNYNLQVNYTNNGSLYYLKSEDHFIFASEKYILQRILENHKEYFPVDTVVNKHLPGKIISNNIDGFKTKDYEKIIIGSRKISNIVDRSVNVDSIKNIKRCSKCILPETFPYIEFDDHGVCNYCKSYKNYTVAGRDKFDEFMAQRLKTRKNKDIDCVIAFSGGRDSSYMLHYLVNEYGVKPITYSYDWGMVTDIARRNQALMAGKLGVEHVYISADILKKRRYIKKNLEAWLKRPRLGLIPLFMAGDKQYFYYASQVAKQNNIDTVFIGGNPLEKTSFKSAFAGMKESTGRPYDVSILKKFKLAGYYGKEYMMNPRYFNESLVDTGFAFFCSFMMPHDFTWFYKYIKWDENVIDKTLQEEYDWEVSKECNTTWRIGDGTSAFYNYIYYAIAGFTENDTLRSNQVREGLLSRDEALDIAFRDNQPQYGALQSYASLVGFSLDEALQQINSVQKLYC